MKNIEESNIRAYYAFIFFREPMLWGPILITYINKMANMPLSEIYFMEACCVIIAVLIQVPTGAFADAFGRAKSIKVGMMFILIEVILFSLADCKLMIWIANTFWAIGMSFMSGADSSLLFDSLKKLRKEDDYRRIEGKANGIRLISVAIIVLSAGHLASINLRLPIIIDSIIVFVGFIISLFFNDKDHPKHTESIKKEFSLRIVRSIKTAWKNKAIMWLIGFSTAISVMSKLWFFTYNGYFEIANIPLLYYGYIFSALNVVAGISSLYAQKINETLNPSMSVNLIFGCLAIPMILMGTIVSFASAFLVLPQNFVRGFAGPFVGTLMHKRIDSKDRATMISIKSMWSQGTEVICMIFFGTVTALLSLNDAILSLGLISFVLWIFFSKTFKKILNEN